MGIRLCQIGSSWLPTMNCRSCSQEMLGAGKYCPSCGARVATPPSAPLPPTEPFNLPTEAASEL